MARKTAARKPGVASEPESHIHLGSQLGIEDAAGLHQQLVAAVDDPRPVVLEGRDIRDIHTAALELFCLFCRDRRAAGRVTRWQEPSEALRNAATLLGLTALMSLAQQGATS
jgi:ABC-type transporter Mla MlaB component